MPGYHLYGLRVSSNRALPALPKLNPDDSIGKPDAFLHWGGLPSELDVERLTETEPFFTSRSHVANGEPVLRVWRAADCPYYFFHYGYGFSFAIESSGKSIWAAWLDSVSFEDVSAYLIGQAFGFALHLRGHVCLHASAVAIAGKAVLFLGDPGAGKSSTAAALAEYGCPMLADDISAVKRGESGKLAVVPSLPRVCLWPDSAEFLYGAGSLKKFRRVHHGEEKYLVEIGESSGKFQAEPAPLEAIYLLAPRVDEPAAPRIEPLCDADKLMGLLANSFETLVLDRDLRREEFVMLGDIARCARVQKLVPSKDPQKLAMLRQLVVGDVHTSAGFPLVARLG